jgi:hypothetical protein
MVGSIKHTYNEGIKEVYDTRPSLRSLYDEESRDFHALSDLWILGKQDHFFVLH